MEWKNSFTEDSIIKILQDYYGVVSKQIDVLPGFEDLNFKVTLRESLKISDVLRTNLLVLKVSRLKESMEFHKNVLQEDLITFLSENGIRVPTPVPTASGKLHTIQNGNAKQGTTICIRALTFVPGVTLAIGSFSDKHLNNIGRTIGKMNSLLQKFKKEESQRVDIGTIWEFSRFTELRTLIPRFCEGEVLHIANIVTDMFENTILPVLHTFKRGYMHGDLSCSNIITTDNYCTNEKCNAIGFIDFGDICHSFYIYDIGIFLVDVLSQCLDLPNALSFCRMVLKGYREIFSLSDNEVNCLRVCMCVRTMSLYIMCSKWIRGDPGNSAIAKHIPLALATCKYLLSIGDKLFIDNVIC